MVVCECEKLATGAQRLGRDIRSAYYACVQHAHLARIRDAQRSSKVAMPIVAQRSATVPARDPAIAEMKRGPRIREAVDGAGDRHALRGAEDEDNKRAHQVPGRAWRQRGGKDRGVYRMSDSGAQEEAAGCGGGGRGRLGSESSRARRRPISRPADLATAVTG